MARRDVTRALLTLDAAHRLISRCQTSEVRLMRWTLRLRRGGMFLYEPRIKVHRISSLPCTLRACIDATPS